MSVSEQLSARPMPHARVVFDTFRSPRDPMLAAWLSFRARVLPEMPAPTPQRPADGTSISGVFGVWRLLATNNRELGRGAALHASPIAATADVTALQAVADTLTVAPVRGSEPLRHAWVLRRDGAPAMMASRWYESAGEATAAGRSAARVLAGAVVIEGVSLGTPSGRRRRQALAPAANA